jgi:hypothetical protein
MDKRTHGGHGPFPTAPDFPLAHDVQSEVARRVIPSVFIVEAWNGGEVPGEPGGGTCLIIVEAHCAVTSLITFCVSSIVLGPR